MTEIWEYITANQAVFTGLAMLLGGVIVKATPTKKDDEWYQKLRSLFGKK